MGSGTPSFNEPSLLEPGRPRPSPFYSQTTAQLLEWDNYLIFIIDCYSPIEEILNMKHIIIGNDIIIETLSIGNIIIIIIIIIDSSRQDIQWDWTGTGWTG